jgi:hypothetical protein
MSRIHTIITQIKRQGKSSDELASKYGMSKEELIAYINRNTSKKVFKGVSSTLEANDANFKAKKEEYKTKGGEQMAKLTSISFESHQELLIDSVKEALKSVETEARPNDDIAPVVSVNEVLEQQLAKQCTDEQDTAESRTEAQIRSELEDVNKNLEEEKAFYLHAEEAMLNNETQLEELKKEIETLEKSLNEARTMLDDSRNRTLELEKRKSDLEEELGSLTKVYLIAPLFAGKRIHHENELSSDDSLECEGVKIISDVQELFPIDFAVAEEIGVDSIAKYRKMHGFVQLVLNFKLGTYADTYGTNYEIIYKKGSSIEKLLAKYECL